MTAAILYILALSIISSPSVPVNKGKGRTTEIAYGTVVDYSFSKKSYPFMARIILDGRKCGGALISDRFVATARHCLEFCPCFNEANSSNDWTRCNKLCFLKLRENSDFISDTETVHIIKTIHLPENNGKPYETRGQRTDFALIELAESANICTEEETARGRCWPVTPVRLPDPSFHIKEGQRVRTLGWGATEFSFGDEQSEFLAQLDITVNSSTLFHFLIETNIGPNGADPCKGDSGGPLLLRGDDLEWTLVGTLVGGGYACENPEGKDTTSDWSKVGLHVPWITSVMRTTAVDKPVTSVSTVDKPDGISTTWLVGGTGTGTSVESFVSQGNGRVCGREISSYPNSYTSAMGGFMRGQVYVCGGNSGTDSSGTYRVHNNCYATSPRNPRQWVAMPDMPVNTTNAAYAVKDEKMYVFGGYQKPTCGYRPHVQIFDSRNQKWSMNSKHDSPNQVVPYGCAATAGNLIFVTGGWYPKDAYPYLSSCQEQIPDDELTAVNADYANYQDRVQIYNTVQETWSQGPRLLTRRRNHGCALVDFGGRMGIMVAGGYNSKDSQIRSVEFMDLGESVSNIQLNGLRWRNLPEMIEARADKLVLINDNDYVHVVGGELNKKHSNIQSFDKIQSRWVSQGYKTKRGRSYTTFISNIKTNGLQC